MMKIGNTISLKDDLTLIKKKKLNLALNILISCLGLSALFIKFFLVDGLLAFRAFTVDGNLFTTVVSVIAVIINVKELADKKENESRRLFFLQLSSAVTEAVIFIVVMIGYLPIFEDDPKITPYHMFCLHVAIPILAVLRFIFFEKPRGILAPSKLLIGAIPIGVYGFGVVTAIKIGILPVELAPYSFLDFDSNFLWYFLFALIVIPSFGFLWSWMFYRLNIRASLLWYSAEDLEKLNKERIKSLSHFDVVNSSILLVYCAMAIIVLMFSLMGTSKTSTKIQHEMLSYVSFFILEDCSNQIGKGEWNFRNGSLYKGDTMVGNGTERHTNKWILKDNDVSYETAIFVKASNLSSNVAARYSPDDYVAVAHSSGSKGPTCKCGDILNPHFADAVLSDERNTFYEEVKVDQVGYYYYCTAFGDTLIESGVGIICMYIPVSELTAQAKAAEYNNNLMMIAIIGVIFSALYVISYMWIRTLERSVDYLRAIAGGLTPEEHISFGKMVFLSGLERQLNVLRDINDD